MTPMHDRRKFLSSASVLGGAVAAGLTNNPKATAQRNFGLLRVRVSAFAPRARLDVYQRGVEAMKARSARNADDKTGWVFQAGIHGSKVDGPHFGMCKHAIWTFLPWHRAYLFYFERILRAAADEASFNLPYWDWNNPRRRSLPAEFRDPKSKLYDDTRKKEVNDGSPLPAREIDVSAALREIDFESPRGTRRVRGFGGSRAEGIKGLLEKPPHDSVHVQISGRMGDPDTAALDPIFWLHHCNVDRLWSAWLARSGGRDNPTANDWKNEAFTFFDENGREVRVKAGDFAETTGLPGDGGDYVYDDLEGPNPVVAAKAATRAQAEQLVPRAPVMAKEDPQKEKAVEEKKQLFGAKPRLELTQTGNVATVLGAAPVTVEAKLVDDTPKLMAQALRVADGAPEEAPQIVLTIDGVKADGPPGVVYRVFLNQSTATASSDAEDANYVGSIALFQSFKKVGDGGHAHGNANGAGESFSFDITDAVKELQARKQWDEKNVKVTLVATGAGKAHTPQAKVTFKGVSLSIEK